MDKCPTKTMGTKMPASLKKLLPKISHSLSSSIIQREIKIPFKGVKVELDPLSSSS
jgi:hypothetical protein